MPGSILIAGATGLIGNTTLRLALSDDRFGKVIALARHDLAFAHPKLETWQHADLIQALRPQRVDAVICCLGTTIRKVDGDKARFIHVDKDLVLALGRWAKEQGVGVFCVVSAIGADPHSKVFYSRVKGEMEEGLKDIGLPSLHLFQPSILTGPRQEKRTGERIGIAVMGALAPLLPDRYKPMPHTVLAAALMHAALTGAPGVHVHTYRAMCTLAEGQKAAS